MNFSVTAPPPARPTPEPEFRLYECEAGRRWSSVADLDGEKCFASGCARDGHTIRLVATTTDRARASRWFWFPAIREVAS